MTSDMTGDAEMTTSIEHQLRQYADAYEQLQTASNTHAAIDRSTENFDEIVGSRIHLDGKRDRARAERKGVVSRYEPPALDVVTERGSYPATKFTIAVAAFSIVLFFGALVWIILGIKAAARPDISIELGEPISITTERPCTMTVPVELTNSSDTSYTTRLVARRVNGQTVNLGMPSAEVAPNSVETFDVSFAVEVNDDGECPTLDTVDEQTILVQCRRTNNGGGGAPVISISAST